MSRKSNNHRPWITKKIRSLRRLEIKLYKKTKKPSATRKDREQYKKIKAVHQSERRKSYWNYINNLIDPPENDQKQNPSSQKKFWRYIKALRKDTTGVASLKENGRLFSDAKTKANILNRQYQSVFTQEDTRSIPTPDGNPYPSMPEIFIEEAGVRKLLQQINPSKAPGPDGIPARVLKECADELAPLMTMLFNKTLMEGKIPMDWKSANITAIFKKGDRNLASNYRPVSLTSLCCKLQEHILVSNMMAHLEKHHILTDCQHGFRPRRGCEPQLITLVHDLTQKLERGIQTDLAILDFSKAFDRVPHQRLLRKIDHYGIRGTTLTWISDFLRNRDQRVVVDGDVSEAGPVSSGVPQGTVLGPILFLLFINDLPDQLKCKTRLFADDCVVYKEIKTEKDCSVLQEDLDKLANWEKKWGMAFHPAKCNILSITRSRNPKTFRYKLKGHVLEPTTTTKYLGIHLSHDMDWDDHIASITKKANSMLGFLRRNLKSAVTSTKTNAYKTIVRPHLEYCSTVWDPHHCDNRNRIEMVQRRAARYATGRYHNTSSVTSMLEDLGWETLESRRKKASLTMFYKIENKLVDINMEDYVMKGYDRTRSNHSKKYRQISNRRSYFQNSFFPRTVPLWNDLPAAAAEAPSLSSFKQELKNLSF
jgi:hypothetical protein